MPFEMRWPLLFLIAGSTFAQNACKGAFPQFEPTIVAKNINAYVIAQKLTNPRGILFDDQGNLLVVENRKGITGLKLKDDGNCVRVESKVDIISDKTVGKRIHFNYLDSDEHLVESWNWY
jgi:hypothetical protein